MTRLVVVGVVLGGLVIASPPEAEACYWDNDTLRMEKRRFPGVLDVITGRFLRHSPAFYQWRVKDREAKLAAGSKDLRVYDDLAVAYAKLGKLDKAIELMQKKEALAPGKYETHANIGTFYMQQGKLAKALQHIKKAIAINPKAHFGREVVQQRLIEYLIAQKKHGLPLDPTGRGQLRVYTNIGKYAKKTPDPKTPYFRGFEARGFHAFVLERKLTAKAALQGILGMMRFANHRSPVLLEVLGDLLLAEYRTKRDAKHLAARAYAHAAMLVGGNTRSRDRYRAKAVLALVGYRWSNLVKTERQLKRELERANRWWKRIERNEKRWIAKGKNPETMFARTYYRKRRR